MTTGMDGGKERGGGLPRQMGGRKPALARPLAHRVYPLSLLGPWQRKGGPTARAQRGSSRHMVKERGGGNESLVGGLWQLF